MKTENLSTAASRFTLRSATELVGDKEPRPAKPAAVATLASATLQVGLAAVAIIREKIRIDVMYLAASSNRY